MSYEKLINQDEPMTNILKKLKAILEAQRNKTSTSTKTL